MSELFDDDPRGDDPKPPPTKTRPNRSRALLITGAVLIAVLFGLTGFASVYTDRLWYESVGFTQVFTTMLWTRVVLFVVFGALLGGAVALNCYLAYRFRPLFRPSSREQTSLDRYRDAVTPIRTWLLIGVAVVVGVFAGTSGMSQWRSYLLWRNGGEFGTTDPYFGRDIGFYVFTLPWVHFLVDFLMTACIIALLAALVVHYLYGGIRLQATSDRLSGAAQVQISVLLGLFVLAKAGDYYLDRFDLVNQQNSLFTGMNYTAENAELPAKNILLGISLICAVLFFLNVWRRTWQLPSVGLALLVVSAILLGAIWPTIVQQLQVEPSQADKEAPYIENNIEATRAAYDLEDVQTQSYSPDEDLPAGELGTVLANINRVPLVDPQLVSPAFENIQQERAYYSVPPVLDVGRYDIGGTERAVVLGVRELNQSGLSPDARNWLNLHTVYTHGNGIIAAYANQRNKAGRESGNDADDGANPSGGIEWAQGINTGENDIAKATGGFETGIYYGEQSPDYSVVGKPGPDASSVELNLPTPAGADENAQAVTYQGEGDADVGSLFNQLMFAVKFGEPNFLLSNRVHDNSKVLFDRHPRERVEKVAPWLTVDEDVYPAVVDGRIKWIVDGYTTTDRYPNSQRESFETMTDDALQVETGLQTVPTDEINYMREAVKATVDAYTGEVTLYAWDEEDPLLQAWMKAFPGSVQPRSAMSDALLEHVRYPEDLFKVQRYQYARYHVENPSDWYQNNDRWQVPVDPQNQGTFQPPYRLFANNGDEDSDQPFSLTSVYEPYEKNNLAAFVSVNSDATSENYGRMRVLDLSNTDQAGNQVAGPSQVANEFISDNRVNQALLPLKNSGAKVTYGNMLTFPVSDGLMYVQPVYASRQVGEASYPELRFVLIKYGNDVGLGTSLAEGVRDLFSGTGTTPSPDGGGDGQGGRDGGTPPPQQGSLQQQLERALDRAEAAFDAAEQALAEQNLAEYQTQVEEAQAALEEAARLNEQIDAAAGGSGAGASGEGGQGGQGGQAGDQGGGNGSGGGQQAAGADEGGG